MRCTGLYKPCLRATKACVRALRVGTAGQTVLKASLASTHAVRDRLLVQVWVKNRAICSRSNPLLRWNAWLQRL